MGTTQYFLVANCLDTADGLGEIILFSHFMQESVEEEETESEEDED